MRLPHSGWPLFLGLLLAAAPARSVEPPAALVDLQGDPLPAGAMARLGSLRWNHGSKLATLHVSADGKTVLSLGEDGQLKFWDPATGKVVRQVQAPGFVQLFSPDVTLCTVQDPQGGQRLHDPATGMELRPFPGNGVAFSPDSKTLLTTAYDRVTRLYTVRLIETATGNTLRTLSEQPLPVQAAAFAPDGSLLALGATDGFIYLHDLATGKEVGRCVGHRSYPQALVFSPDSKTLASGAKDNSVRFWEAPTGKELRRFDAPPATQLAFAPDGKALTIVSSETASCRVIETDSGKVLRALTAPSGLRSATVLSRDGRVLASMAGLSAIRLWDLKTGEQQGPAQAVQPLTALAFSPDGKTLASGSTDQRVYLWEVATGKLLHRLHGHQAGVLALAFSPDGKLLASGSSYEDLMVCIWDPVSGKELRQLPGQANGTQALHFLAGSNTLLAVTRRGFARRWDAATGQELPVLQISGFASYFSADARHYLQSAREANSLNIELQLIETATGKVTRKIVLEKDQRLNRLALSPDSRWIIASGATGPFADQQRDHLYDQWDAATGKKVRSFGKLNEEAQRPVPQTWLTFSPDGRLLADTDRSGRLRLWELSSGQERLLLAGHTGNIAAGAFTPDGKCLATAGSDGQALLWDLYGLHTRKPQAPLQADELATAWTELGDTGAKGLAALSSFLRVPEQTLPLFKERVQPVAPLAAERAARLVADLDSTQFEVRDQATKELEAAGEPAASALRKVLTEQKPSLEVRQRLETILSRIDGFAVSPERLRLLRALEVLEHHATPESQAILKAVAGGVPEARLTHEARSALERLARRAPATP